MRIPIALALRSIALATASLVASSGTILAHAGEPHADPSPGGWSAVGWYGVAAVGMVLVALWLLTRARPEEHDAPFSSAGLIGDIADDRSSPPA